MLVFIASTAPWVKFLLSHVYTSITAAIDNNTSHLARTNTQFRTILKEACDTTVSTRVSTFVQSKTAITVHSSPHKHWINKTLHDELHILLTALESPHLSVHTPIEHLVHRDPSAIAWSNMGDSALP